MRSLNQLKIGESAKLTDVKIPNAKHLLELGFTPGVTVRIHHKSPFKGPISVELRGTIIALRYEEALCLEY